MVKDKIETQRQEKTMLLSKAFDEYIFLTREIHEAEKDAITSILKNYITRFYNSKDLQYLNEEFFKKFYNYYLPMNVGITDYQVEKIVSEWYFFSNYLEKNFHLNHIKSISKMIYKEYNEEIHRIHYVTKEIRKYGEMPVICWNPFIIDIACYRNMKQKENNFTKYIVYNQGYFILQDKIGSHVIFKKKDQGRDFYKIKIDLSLASEMKIGDICHMSIKRKMFSTSWNLIHAKGYFNKSAMKYISSGG